MLQRLGEFARSEAALSDEGDDHPGVDFTRLAHDIFTIDGPFGQHYCIAAKPQGSSLRTLQEVFPNSRLPKILVRSLVHRLLFSLNWLHATCEVVHTGTIDEISLFESID